MHKKGSVERLQNIAEQSNAVKLRVSIVDKRSFATVGTFFSDGTYTEEQ